jgi:subtilase family serine protease
MKKLNLFLFFLFYCCFVFSQNYKDRVNFEADLYKIIYIEEAVRPAEDTSNFTWVKRPVKSNRSTIYIECTKKNTLIGMKFPEKMTLKSEDLPNNGFIAEKFFDEHKMYRQSYAKDEKGNVWVVTVGKDSSWEIESVRDDGRIYISVQDTKNLQSGWYFLLKPM